MSELFLFVLNRSISALPLVGAVLLARLALKKAPRWIFVILWALVALRLVLPALPESPVSLIPSSQTVSPEIMIDPTPTIQTGIPAVNSAVNPIITQSFSPSPGASANPLQILIPLAAAVWLVGVAGMGLYACISTWRLRRRLREATVEEGNVFRCAAVDSPFILGLFNPRIYLPERLAEPELGHVLAHERAHLARKDHWWKPLGFALLSIHWFNPVLWLAYILLCRDIEFACDQRVIRDLPVPRRADYSQTLLRLSVHSRPIAACPLAFGESGVKGRIRGVLNYRKPAFWVLVLALVLCVAVAVFFLTDPRQQTQDPIVPGGDSYLPLEELPEDYSLAQARLDGCVVMEDGDITFGWDIWQDFYLATQFGTPARVRYVTYYNLGDPSRYGEEYYESIKDEYPKMFIHDLTYDGSVYHVRWFEETGELNRYYKYLHCFQGTPESPYATFERYTYFVLCNLPDVTWERISFGMYSSQMGDYIDHMTVVSDYVYPGEEETNRLSPGLYVPVQCLYMSPLSSYSGTRLSQTYLYEVTEDGFITRYLPEGSSSEEVVQWQWEPISIGGKTFRAHPLYPFLIGEGSLAQPVGNNQYILKEDSYLYLVHVRKDTADETVFWSVYALLPETGHTAEVVSLLDNICLAPAWSSNPGDYIRANEDQYNALTAMGEDALQVCFTLFLQGGETGLRGHIMALACQDILRGMGEELPDIAYYMTGQDWFDGYRAYLQMESDSSARPGGKLLSQLIGPL